MINIRYHIVSLTAVFLALAIGVAMGTGFLNKATVDQLRKQIAGAERGIEQANTERAAAEGEVKRYQDSDAALFASSGLLIGDRVKGVPILVVANENIDSDSLDRLRILLSISGADLRGTLTVTDRLRLDAGDDDTLAALVGGTSPSRPVLQSALTTAFAKLLGEAAVRPTDSNATAPELVQQLIDAKYLGYQPPSEGIDSTSVLAGGGYRYVFASGPDPRVPDSEFLLPVLANLAKDGPAPVVAVSAAVGDQAEATRTTWVGAIRDDTDLRDEISTVDDLERFTGLLATVLALDDLVADGRGHYGIGTGSQSELPIP